MSDKIMVGDEIESIEAMLGNETKLDSTKGISVVDCEDRNFEADAENRFESSPAELVGFGDGEPGVEWISVGRVL